MVSLWVRRETRRGSVRVIETDERSIRTRWPLALAHLNMSKSEARRIMRVRSGSYTYRLNGLVVVSSVVSSVTNSH